mmetsp:Transcript_61237/g.181105  ORF Transcript_61237/g.181105 Transcript_61237/m.181105 type:complete len:411 (+) Transcript_61237:361-1593(+)
MAKDLGPRILELEKHQRQCHDHHSRNERVRHDGVLWVIPVSRREELPRADGDHHPPHEPEEDGIHLVRKGVGEDGPPQEGSNGLGHTGDARPKERLPAISRGVVDGEGDAKALRDIVYANGNSQDESDARILQCRDEGGKALREVMQSDGDGSVHPHPHELAILSPGQCVVHNNLWLLLFVAIVTAPATVPGLVVVERVVVAGGKRLQTLGRDVVRRHRFVLVPSYLILLLLGALLPLVQFSRGIRGAPDAVGGHHLLLFLVAGAAHPISELFGHVVGMVVVVMVLFAAEKLDEETDKQQRKDPPEEAQSREAVRPLGRLPRLLERSDALGEDLHERHVGHDPRRYPQGARQDALRRQFDEGREEHHRRSQGGRGSGADDECEGRSDVGGFDRSHGYFANFLSSSDVCAS